MASEPREQGFNRGVASVPQRPTPVRAETGSFPVVDYPTGFPYPTNVSPAGHQVATPSPTRTDPPVRPARRSPPGRVPPLAPSGLIVRRRWRRLRAGAGWTWTGLLVIFFCWGIWAVSIRGNDLIGPVIGLLVVLLVAGFLFVVARLLGRTVLEQALQRERPSAWPSHLTVCVFLTLAGIGFLQQTQWIVDSWRWLTDLWSF